MEDLASAVSEEKCRKHKDLKECYLNSACDDMVIYVGNPKESINTTTKANE